MPHTQIHTQTNSYAQHKRTKKSAPPLPGIIFLIHWIYYNWYVHAPRSKMRSRDVRSNRPSARAHARSHLASYRAQLTSRCARRSSQSGKPRCLTTRFLRVVTRGVVWTVQFVTSDRHKGFRARLTKQLVRADISRCFRAYRVARGASKCLWGFPGCTRWQERSAGGI